MNSNLNYMSKIFNIQHNKAHRALDDAIATTHLLINYLNIFISKNIQKINHLYYPRNRYELDRANFTKGTSLNIILEKMDTIKTPSLISLKGVNGIILYSLPFNNSKADRVLISSKITDLPWETVTIKLIGPLVEILIYFNNLFTKLDLTAREEIIQHLWNQHLPHINKEKAQMIDETDSSDIYSSAQITSELGDFVITHHLVPEQLFIYPIQSMHPKSELVFRYPGHKKKLLQYINSKSSRISSNKLTKTHFRPMLRKFIEKYLLDAKENKSDIFFFRKKDPLKTPDDFFEELDDFLLKNPNPYNYPKHHI